MADNSKPIKPDYTFRNGDKIIIGFTCMQVLDGELKKVLDWYEPSGQTYYIKPGTTFTYQIVKD
jgi:hypothetical protein